MMKSSNTQRGAAAVAGAKGRAAAPLRGRRTPRVRSRCSSREISGLSRASFGTRTRRPHGASI